MNDIVHRSISQYNRYLQCGEQYRLERVVRVPVLPAAWLAQGTAFHKAIQEWEESGRSINPVKKYESLYDAEIERMKLREPNTSLWLRAPSKTTQQDIKERRDRGANMTLLYQNLHSVGDRLHDIIIDVDEFTIGIEVPFVFSLNGLNIHGSIDQIIQHPEGVEPRDLKTGNREQSPLQLAVYTLAIEKIFGWKVVKASYYYAKDGKLVTLSRKDLNRYSEKYLSELFSALDRGITAEVFLPNPGSHCTLCPVRKYCREMGDL